MSATEVETPARVQADNGVLANNDLARQHTVNVYDASKPGKDDLISYEGTYWRYVCGTGWVEQDWDSQNQRARDKGLPKGPDDNISVKGFGEAVTVKEGAEYAIKRAGTVWARGISYAPENNEEGVYKIEWNCVVSYWDPVDQIWYYVKWDKSLQKFTKGDRAAPEGFTTKKGQTVRKWCDSNFTVKDVHVGQQFYDGNTWWVKQGGQLVEQEWNERTNQFEAKNVTRGPSGKLVVGRFGRKFPKSELASGVYQDPRSGEIEYLGKGERSYMDADTGVVYYRSMNGVSHMYWWYANWDGGIGKFTGSWALSFGPTSENIREWIPSTSEPFDLDAAEDGVIVWYNKMFWKKINGVWEEHGWDGKNRVFYIKETTLPPRALIAPVADDTPVKLFGNSLYSVSSIRGLGISAKGAYKMEDGDNVGKVYWWDGGVWKDAIWTGTGKFEPGTKKENPIGSLVKRFNSGMKLCEVNDNQELWYKGTLWRKKVDELVQCTWSDGSKRFEQMHTGKKVPIGKSVKVVKVSSRYY